jgi:hypothetical protein
MATEAQVGFDQRAAVLRRFRELLAQQRDKFQKYLVLLDHERSDIESGDVDRLVAHVELEEQIVSEIFTFQKVIDPLEDLYRSVYPHGQIPADGAELPELKESLEDLRGEVLRRNAENRTLLKLRMEAIRTEIAGLRMPMKARRSVYADGGEGNVLDMNG